MPEAAEHAAIEITDATFATEVTQKKGLVMVDFWAAWCPPCRMMAPYVEAIAKKYQNDPRVSIGKLNVDENQGTGTAQRILSLPTFRFFYDGVAVDDIVGANPPALEKKVQEILAKHPVPTAA